VFNQRWESHPRVVAAARASATPSETL
jgi:hypothetical protein